MTDLTAINAITRGSDITQRVRTIRFCRMISDNQHVRVDDAAQALECTRRNIYLLCRDVSAYYPIRLENGVIINTSYE